MLLLRRGGFSDDELLHAFKKVKENDVLNVPERQIKHGKFQSTSLIMGNLDKANARDIKKKLDEIEHQLRIDTDEHLDKVETIKEVIRPRDPIEVRKMNPREDDPN